MTVSVAGNAAKTPFDLIIFDCDGVLVDSEVISTHTLLETLVASGVKIDIDYVRKTYLGRSMSVVEADYQRLTGRPFGDKPRANSRIIWQCGSRPRDFRNP